jgi:hypothetical protein
VATAAKAVAMVRVAVVARVVAAAARGGPLPHWVGGQAAAVWGVAKVAEMARAVARAG